MLLVISGRLKVLKKLSNRAKKKKKKTGFMQLNISTDLKASEEQTNFYEIDEEKIRRSKQSQKKVSFNDDGVLLNLVVASSD